jgi:hypothetical protein
MKRTYIYGLLCCTDILPHLRDMSCPWYHRLFSWTISAWRHDLESITRKLNFRYPSPHRDWQRRAVWPYDCAVFKVPEIVPPLLSKATESLGSSSWGHRHVCRHPATTKKQSRQHNQPSTGDMKQKTWKTYPTSFLCTNTIWSQTSTSYLFPPWCSHRRATLARIRQFSSRSWTSSSN